MAAPNEKTLDDPNILYIATEIASLKNLRSETYDE